MKMKTAALVLALGLSFSLSVVTWGAAEGSTEGQEITVSSQDQETESVTEGFTSEGEETPSDEEGESAGESAEDGVDTGGQEEEETVDNSMDFEEIEDDQAQEAAVKVGWSQDSQGSWYYYQDTEGTVLPVTGEQQIGEKRYLFDETGRLLTGFQWSADAIVYYSETGANPERGLGAKVEKAGWLSVDGKSYYLDGDATVAYSVVQGWKTIGKYNFYFMPGDDLSVAGQMATSWVNVDGKDFYFKATGNPGLKGAMLTGWNTLGGKVFYFHKDDAQGTKGQMATGWTTLDSKTYYFKATGDPGVKGQMFTSWIQIAGKKYYFKATGDYGVRGQMFLGWQNIGGHTFYFKATGDPGLKGMMFTSWKTIGGKVFYFKASGENGVKGQVFSGWSSISGKKYYFKTNNINGRKGTMLTGLRNVDFYRYYFRPSGGYGTKGSLVTGYVKSGSSEYVFQEEGKLGILGRGINGWIDLKRGRCYCVDGKIQKSKYADNYYLGTTGAMSSKSKKLYDLVQQVIASNTNSGMTSMQKLRACYNYVSSSAFRYVRKYSFQNIPAWHLNYAYEFFSTKGGNCYNFAAGFDFIAKELGYDSESVIGMITSASGGMTPHSWVEMNIGGEIYMFDPEMQHAKGYDLFMKKYYQTGMTYRKLA